SRQVNFFWVANFNLKFGIFVLFVIGAATYGSLTADKKIILKQGGSAILALISILLFKYT
ncbi:DUF1304 family protein, partial [Streptococcus pneumoniae]